jgi:oxygen-dependent protoporphyrinogen oxidase
MARIAVLGGGLAGLVAAHRLARANHRVIVLEAADRFGGQLHTEHSAGYVVEHGAEGFVARSEVVPKLARELGVIAQLVGQELTRSLGYRQGALHELSPGEAASFLGFQVAREDLGQGIRTFQKGMGSLIDALLRKLASDVELRLGQRVTQLDRRARGYQLRNADGNALQADRVIVASSARSAGELLAPVVGPAATELTAATTLSNVSVSLAFARDAIAHPLDATGFVIAAEDQLHGVRACTFTSSKFAQRAPEDSVSLRVFFRPDARELKMLPDSTYVIRALEVIARVLQPKSPPLHSWVARWPDALPVFDPASKQLVSALEAALRGSGIALAGSAYHGAGIDAAVRSGMSVAERL